MNSQGWECEEILYKMCNRLNNNHTRHHRSLNQISRGTYHIFLILTINLTFTRTLTFIISHLPSLKFSLTLSYPHTFSPVP